MDTVFEDRHDAGRRLSTHLGAYAGEPDLLVLGLPRGGVPVAYEVARALGAELDVLVVRKLGVPGQPEFAMGAIAGDGVEVLDRELIHALRVTREQLEAAILSERDELARREKRYRGGRPPARVRDRTVLVVDDGLATGASMTAALHVLRARGAGRVVVAVPVGPPDTRRLFGSLADDVVCVSTPHDFRAVGSHYHRFEQTTDEEVRELLAAGRLHESVGVTP